LVTDSSQSIAKKINASVSGGQATKEEQERLGADLTVDVAWQYLNIFLEDDKELVAIGEDYKAGKLMSSVLKQRLT
jgi:tryptophanyl-tRNA synthetase